MKLPNGDRAQVSDAKLFGYILNPHHDEGRHHARLFDHLLGINQDNADVLRSELLRAARDNEAIPGKHSKYGDKYEIRFEMAGPRGRYTVLSVWFISDNGPVSRLVTAYVT